MVIDLETMLDPCPSECVGYKPSFTDQFLWCIGVRIYCWIAQVASILPEDKM